MFYVLVIARFVQCSFFDVQQKLSKQNKFAANRMSSDRYNLQMHCRKVNSEIELNCTMDGTAGVNADIKGEFNGKFEESIYFTIY